MPTTLEQTHQVFEIVSGAAMLGAFIVGMMIKTSLGTIREGQLEQQIKALSAAADLKEKLVAHNEQTARELEVHQAEDRIQFGQIKDTLARIEAK